jgi:hypothetical protein
MQRTNALITQQLSIVLGQYMIRLPDESSRMAKRNMNRHECVLLRHGVLLVFGAPCQLQSLAGQEHGRTIPLAEVAALRICDAAAAVIEVRHGFPDGWRKSLKGRHPRGPPRSLHVSRSGGLLQRQRLSAPRDHRGRRGRRAQSSTPNPLYSKRSSTVRFAG